MTSNPNSIGEYSKDRTFLAMNEVEIENSQYMQKHQPSYISPSLPTIGSFGYLWIPSLSISPLDWSSLQPFPNQAHDSSASFRFPTAYGPHLDLVPEDHGGAAGTFLTPSPHIVHEHPWLRRDMPISLKETFIPLL